MAKESIATSDIVTETIGTNLASLMLLCFWHSHILVHVPFLLVSLGIQCPIYKQFISGYFGVFSSLHLRPASHFCPPAFASVMILSS